jgi:monovalent cation/proton antiporter MnhG/PhaG subunit
VDVIAAVAIRALLAIGAAACAFTVIGLLRARGAYQRLHYSSVSATVGIAAIIAALLVREGGSQLGIKSILAGIVVVLMNPVLAHATARAFRIHEHGQWPPKPEERVPVVRGEGPL